MRRILCWIRGFHIVDAAGIAKFRYDCPGICHDCGNVGSGVPIEDGE
jgi:hypothetical protein